LEFSSVKHFLVRDAIVPALTATTKEGVIRELVGSLQAVGFFGPADVDRVIGEILRRESLGSTGIGRGVAIPHSRHEGLPKLIGALGLAKAGIPFESIDAQPVHIVLLLVSRPDQPGPHLRALETVVRMTEDDDFLEKLKACTTVDEIWSLIHSAPDPWGNG
jgi:nitrogen PTS system EIIA component